MDMHLAQLANGPGRLAIMVDRPIVGERYPPRLKINF